MHKRFETDARVSNSGRESAHQMGCSFVLDWSACTR